LDQTDTAQPSITLAVDTVSKRPACVLLQAVFGLGENNFFLQQTFDPKHWLVAPTQDMAPVAGTPDQWRRLARELDGQ